MKSAPFSMTASEYANLLHQTMMVSHAAEKSRAAYQNLPTTVTKDDSVMEKSGETSLYKSIVDAVTFTGIAMCGVMTTQSQINNAPRPFYVLRHPNSGGRLQFGGLQGSQPRLPMSLSTSTTAGTTEDIHMSAYRSELATSVLSEIYTLHSSGQTKKAQVSVYDNICGLLADGRIRECDLILNRVEESKASSKILLSFLMATTQIAREKLPSRRRVYEIALSKYTREIGDARALKLLERYA